MIGGNCGQNSPEVGGVLAVQKGGSGCVSVGCQPNQNSRSGSSHATISYVITMAANVLISTTLAEERSMSATNGHVLISRSISPSILYPEIERERRDRESERKIRAYFYDATN